MNHLAGEGAAVAAAEIEGDALRQRRMREQRRRTDRAEQQRRKTECPLHAPLPLGGPGVGGDAASRPTIDWKLSFGGLPAMPLSTTEA